jgi:hypothetical protein
VLSRRLSGAWPGIAAIKLNWVGSSDEDEVLLCRKQVSQIAVKMDNSTKIAEPTATPAIAPGDNTCFCVDWDVCAVVVLVVVLPAM